jgi:hypothetical protein
MTKMVADQNSERIRILAFSMDRFSGWDRDHRRFGLFALRSYHARCAEQFPASLRRREAEGRLTMLEQKNVAATPPASTPFIPDQGLTRWHKTLAEVRGWSVNDPLPLFARRRRPVSLVYGGGLFVSSNSIEIPAAMYAAPDCTLAPTGRDIDCEHPQGEIAVIAVLVLTNTRIERAACRPP